MQAGNKQAEEDARRVGQYSPSEKVDSAQQLAGRLLTTVYMGTVNSSRETKDRAASLARQVLSLAPESGHRIPTEVTCSCQVQSLSLVVICVDHSQSQYLSLTGVSATTSLRVGIMSLCCACHRLGRITWTSR